MGLIYLFHSHSSKKKELIPILHSSLKKGINSHSSFPKKKGMGMGMGLIIPFFTHVWVLDRYYLCGRPNWLVFQTVTG